MSRLLAVFLVFNFSCSSLAQSQIDVFETGIVQLQEALGSGQTTSLELVEQYLARINAYDQQGPALNSIIRLNPQARAQAEALDAERRSSGPRSLLHGIPIVVKDNYNTTDMPTTGASVALAGFVPSANATQIDKLLAAGVIILAKTNLHEYAYGITSISSLQGQTRNPYDYRRVPGGSSGGTAAAVAASFAAIGLGSDTCGSIRIPSAFNNLIGLRPSKGFSSIYGVMPLSHTQDVAGPLARTAEDLAILLDVVGGYDANDAATSLVQGQALPLFQQQLTSARLQGVRLGRLTSYMQRANSSIRQQIELALSWYEEMGAEIIDVDIPELDALVASSGVIGHEFKVDLEQYLSQFLSGEITNLNDIVDLGLYHAAVQGALVRSRASVRNDDSYAVALAARDELRQEIEQFMQSQNLDAIVYPPIAELQVFVGENQPGNNCSISANSGLPALSMPVGFTDSGLPVGMELLGNMLADAELLALAYAYEQANRPRQAPSATPALVAGMAPAPQRKNLRFAEAGIGLSAEFEFDLPRNELHYSVSVDANNAGEFYAATLMIDADEAFGLNDPVVLNLIGPQGGQASGDYFMSPAFRAAFQEQRVYLKVFANSLPTAGATRVLD